VGGGAGREKGAGQEKKRKDQHQRGGKQHKKSKFKQLLHPHRPAPASLLERSRPLLERSAPGKTGQNRIWLAGVHIMKGCLWNEPGMIAEGARQIFAETAVAPRGKEGLQPDWSFHQHGPQIQFGNYGGEFFSNIGYWSNIWKGTRWELSPEQWEIMRHLAFNGFQWVLWNGDMDLLACGRQLGRHQRGGDQEDDRREEVVEGR